MNKYTFMTLKLAAACLLSMSAFAGTETADRITVGDRPMAHTEWLQIQQERSEEEEKSLEDLVDLELPQNTATESSTADLLKAESAFTTEAGTYYTSHNGAFHNPYFVSIFGDQVELEDGSIWSVASGDSYKTLNWYTSDLIVVTPNHEWFSSYMFRMHNQNTNVSVKCNLLLGPIYNGIFTHWIIAINYYTQEIWLEDGSIWQVTGFDSSTFSKWLANDTVILGVNDGFLSSSKPNILINVNTLTYVRANCIW